MVRSRTPDPRAFFLPSAPPDSYRFCISVAMLLSTSGEELTDCARLVSLGMGGGGEGGRGGEGGGGRGKGEGGGEGEGGKGRGRKGREGVGRDSNCKIFGLI